MGPAMDLGTGVPERRRVRGLSGRGAVIAVVGPAAAGVASIPLARNGPAAAIALFLLAIVIAAVAGGFWAGVLAAALSSIGLPLLYGSPSVELGLDRTEEVLTALAFLAVALVVGILVGGAAEERARATRREREARLPGHLSPGGPDTVVPLVVGPVSFGTLRVERPLGRRPLGPHEHLLLEAASKQAAA